LALLLNSPSVSFGLNGSARLQEGGRVRFAIFWLGTVWLAGCGATDGGGYPVRIVYPQALTRSERRFEAFLARVRQIEVSWDDGAHLATHWAAPGAQKIALPRAWTGATGELQVRIWDTTEDGFPRTYAALSGRRKLRASDFGQGAPLELRLKLHVSVENY